MKQLFLFFHSIFTIFFHVNAQNIHVKKTPYCDTVTYWSIANVIDAGNGNYYGCGSGRIGANDINGQAIYAKLDSNFKVIWQKDIGGSKADYFTEIYRIAEDRILLFGASKSDSATLGFGYPLMGGRQPILVVVDTNGNVLHKIMYGYGSETAVAGKNFRNCVVLPNGNVFIASFTQAEFGDFSINTVSPFYTQGFVAMCDTALNKKWIRMLPSPIDNGVSGICPYDDTTILVCNAVQDSFGDYNTSYHKGKTDVLLFTIDTSMHIAKKIKLGGTEPDSGSSPIIDEEKNIYLASSSKSKNGDFYTPEVALNSNLYSYWNITKLDSNFNIIWKKNFGNFFTNIQCNNCLYFNEAVEMILDKDNLWLLAVKDSITDSVFSPPPKLGGLNDIWIGILNTQSGNLTNKIRIGTDTNDGIGVFKTVGNKKLAWVYGRDNAQFGCFSSNRLIVQIVELEYYPDTISNNSQIVELIKKVYPNPSNNNINIEVNGIYNLKEIEINILDSKASTIYKNKKLKTTELFIDVAEWPSGTYIIEALYRKSKQTFKITVKH